MTRTVLPFNGFRLWESWKPIPGYENYEVSTFGRIINRIGGMTLKQSVTTRGRGHQAHSGGYCMAHLGGGSRTNKKSVLAHRLVAQAFIPNPENKPEVNHINGDQKANNCVLNLEWATRQENLEHAKKHGLRDGWWAKEKAI